MQRDVIRWSFFIALLALLAQTLAPVVSANSATASGLAASVVPSEPAEPVAPLDAPTVLVSEDVNEWTVGAGLLYWALNCLNDEVSLDGYLRRMPSHGGTTRTLATRLRSNCNTFQYLAADDSGLYYYSVYDMSGAHRIEKRSTSSPDDPPTIVYTSGPRPNDPVTDLVLDELSIYWASSSGNILRIGKDGSGILVIASTGANPTDMVVGANNVYWLDDDGLWRADKNCSALPCPAKQRLAVTQGNHLLLVYGSLSGVPPAIYWVEFGTQQRIRRYACNPFTGCSVATLYIAPADHNWRLGQLGTDGTHLFWKESYFETSSSNDGRLRRMPIYGGTVDDIAVNLLPFDGRLFTDDLYVYFRGEGGLSRLPFDASAILRDLAVSAWEVTQGIQSLTNDVPLVANKPTYVRVYGVELDGPNVNSVEAYLYGTRNGSPLPGSPLKSVNGTRALATGSNYNRANKNDGWLFQLPDGWTDLGSITLQAVVDPRQTYTDPHRPNNSRSGTFTFTRKAPVCPVFVPVRTHSPYASTSDPNFWRMIDLFARLWPVPDVWVYHQNSDIAESEWCTWRPCFGPYEIPEDNWKIITSLIERDTFSDNPDECQAAGARTHYVGMVHPSTSTTIYDGFANYYLAAAWVKFPPHDPTPPTDWTWPIAGGTMAQELAHNYNRRHVDCGDPDDVDGGYPYPPCQLDNLGPTAHYGFDVNTQTPIVPTTTKDYMSYSLPRWVSDYTWKAMFNNINSTATDQVESATQLALNMTVAQDSDPVDARVDLAAAASVVLASGVITPSLNQGHLNYAWVFPTAILSQGLLQKWQTLAAPGTATSALQRTGVTTPTYHLRLLAANGAVLDDRTFVPFENVGMPKTYVFALTFPTPASTVARLELVVDTTVIASLEPGPNVSTVNILQPAGGEVINDQMTVIWQASDADRNDTLLYSIQYSPDQGLTWRSLVSSFPGSPDSNTVTLTLSSLSGIPGSSPSALIRVAASDGYNTAIATSQPVQVSNRSPMPYIISPMPGQSFAAGQPVALRGGASDAEDGALNDTVLRWTVDGRDNGTGQEQRVEGLAPGTYDVELAARDSAWQERTAHASLNVASLRVPLSSQPALDGYCDDAAYASGATLQLRAYTDDAQGTVHLIRTRTDVWVCFSNMERGSGGLGAFAGVRVDVNNSRDALAQPNDYGFFVGEDGTPFTVAGDGVGGFTNVGAGGLLARTSANDVAWSAELRIDASVLGGWNHPISLDLAHYGVRNSGDDYHWPYLSRWNQPNTWAITVLEERRIFLPLVMR